MSVLLAGKPELTVGFSRHKIASPEQAPTDTWDRAGLYSEGSKAHPSSENSSPPPTSTENSDYGMCARSQTTTSTVTATTTSSTATSSDTDRRRTDLPQSSESNHHNVDHSAMDIAIRCTAPSCPCEGFAPSKAHIRMCDSCQHGWVAHALEKLGFRQLFNCHQVELVQATTAFDVASLMLYGTEALPIRLKILLDRLFSVLQRDEVVHVLHGFGWTYEDYARGYILQDVRGQVLERWTMPSREEEPLILQQFLRFGETKPIAQQLLAQETIERIEPESDIKRFFHRSGLAPLGNSLTPLSFSRPSNAVTPSVVSPVTPTSTGTVVLSPVNKLPPIVPTTTRASRPPSNVSSAESVSPTTAPSTTTDSPVSSSPLNKLQNMQPYDFRRDRSSPVDVKPPVFPALNFAHQTTPLHSPTASSYPHLPISTSYMMNSNSVRLGSMTSDLSLSATDEGSENETDGGAINLSQHSDLCGGHHRHIDSIFAAKKIRHLRKSANPMKRRWNPMMLSGLTTNPTTGKKRVQCHVCLKTFCDKGALKIHFSAVHLREMHKCTVDGCNMMFSSRRSRNRHSANPNPKLHTPNLRRKMSHHDGRSSLPYPLIPSSTLMNFNNGNTSLMSVPPTLHPVISSGVESPDRTIHSSEADLRASKHMENNIPSSTVEDYSPDGVRSSFERHLRKTIIESPDDVLQLTKKSRLEHLNGDVSNDGDEGIDLSVKEDRNQMTSLNKGVRKRKSFNPTKCTAASDDDLQYISTDDSSTDTFIDDNGMLSKSDEFSSDLLEDDSKDNDLDKEFGSSLDPPHFAPTTSSSSQTSNIPTTSIMSFHTSRPEERHEKSHGVFSFASNYRSQNLSSKENEPSTLDLSSKHHEPLVKSNQETEEVSESPLRHLETLSLGAFTGLLNHTKSTFSHHISSSTCGISFHAPGLGLASSGPTPSISDSLTREKSSRHPAADPQPLPLSIQNSVMSINNTDSDPEGQIQMLPMYRDASMMNAVDVPVDKENPRRCIACGKIFQNHFGVKTHYQNVHLKLMHKCTVEGCNAAFPSKRSRDRHSANLNLHRKLLSTTADKGHYFDKGATIFPYPHHAALREDYFSRLYDPQNLPLNFADFYHGRLPETFLSSSPFGSHLNMTTPLSMMPNFHPAFMVPTSTSSLHESPSAISDGRDTPLSSISSSPSPRLHSPSSPSSSSKDRPRSGRQPLTLESELTSDSDGRFPCNFCHRLFADAAHLKDHYEGTHLPSLVPCPSENCHKVFLSKSDKDKHCSKEDHGIHRIKRESPSVS